MLMRAGREMLPEVTSLPHAAVVFACPVSPHCPHQPLAELPIGGPDCGSNGAEGCPGVAAQLPVPGACGLSARL